MNNELLDALTILEKEKNISKETVSYTHLTLPTT